MNVAPPPGSLRPEPPASRRPRRRCRGRARSLAHRRHPAGQGGDAGAGRAGIRGRPRHLRLPGARRAVRPAAGRRRRAGAGQPVGGAAAGRCARRAPDPGLGGTPPRFRRRTAACAVGAAVRRRRGGARDIGGVLRRRLLPFRHPGLVQRSDPRGGHRVAAGLARISGRAPRQHPRRRAGDGERSDACRPVPDRRSVGVRRGAGDADRRCAA